MGTSRWGQFGLGLLVGSCLSAQASAQSISEIASVFTTSHRSMCRALIEEVPNDQCIALGHEVVDVFRDEFEHIDEYPAPMRSALSAMVLSLFEDCLSRLKSDPPKGEGTALDGMEKGYVVMLRCMVADYEKMKSSCGGTDTTLYQTYLGWMEYMEEKEDMDL